MTIESKLERLANFIADNFQNEMEFCGAFGRYILSLSYEQIKAINEGETTILKSAPEEVLDMIKEGEAASTIENSFQMPGLLNKRASDLANSMERKKITEAHNLLAIYNRFNRGVNETVEVACGEGQLSNYFALFMPQKIRMRGFDIDGRNISKARTNAKRYATRVNFFEENVMENKELISGEESAVLCLHGCNHIANKIVKQANAKLIMMAPCCYEELKPEDYILSEAAKGILKQKGLVLMPEMGNVFHAKQDEQWELAVNKDEFERRKGSLPFDDKGSFVEDLTRYTMMKRLFKRPFQALLCVDRAMHLQERGFETAKVFQFMPSSLNSGGYLIVGANRNDRSYNNN